MGGNEMHSDEEMREPVRVPLAMPPGPHDVLYHRLRGGPQHGPGPLHFRGPRGGNPFGGNPFGGFPPHDGNPFGRPPFGGPPRPPVRPGPRVARGDVRAAILALLAEQPWNGYQMIQEIGRRSGGVWKPSSGSVYPALQQLEDEGLVRAEEHDGRRVFQLTDAGRAYVDARPEELAAPWQTVAEGVDERVTGLQALIGQVGMASMQVVAAGTDAQIAAARQVLADARRALYRILAEDSEDGHGTG
jgi:DNA-binding PadR family transcriptional regulator